MPAVRASSFDRLTVALDEESYDWMELNFPNILDAIEHAVKAGADATAVRRQVLHQTQRPLMASRCEQVARHLRQAHEVQRS